MRKIILLFMVFYVAFFIHADISKQKVDIFTAEDVLNTKSIGEYKLSPNGKWIAYTLSVQRKGDEKSGGAYRELYLFSVKTKKAKSFIIGKVTIRNIQWNKQGTKLAFVRKGEKHKKNQVWSINIDGGEAQKLTNSKTGVSSYKWFPDGKKIAFSAIEAKTKKETELKKKGYRFIYFEENLRHKNLYVLQLPNKNLKSIKPQQITKDITVVNFEISPDGKKIAASMIEKNLVDYNYMFRRIFLIDLKTKTWKQISENKGKLGSYQFSPDGKKLVYTAALDRKDHAVSQVFLTNLKTKKTVNLTKPSFKGHVSWAKWKNNQTIYYRSAEGVNTTISTVSVNGGSRKIILNSKLTGIVFRSASFTKDFKYSFYLGSTPKDPSNLYMNRIGKKRVLKLTNINPWLNKRTLGKQEIIKYKAVDGLEIEGLLIYPVAYKSGSKYPLVVIVHGGPESNYSNGWLTRYSSPAQVLAGRGYVVFYPNYRASTGYGVKFAAMGYKDAAGKEFDDIKDGIKFLISQGIADKERVGLGGGSYGGYAAAWFASYYTKYVKAVCMFVGISDIISKSGTTDIPYEEQYVHSGKKLEDSWKFSLERSPIYWAHQSKSAVLILGGASDTRVHPTQSIEFFRRLKMNDHPAVRLVQYPGEGHGNRKQPGQIDVLYRILDWYDWYVRGKKSFNGPMPPLDISNKYGLKLKK